MGHSWRSYYEGEEIEDALKRELYEEIPSISNIQICHLMHACKDPRDFLNGTGLILLFYKVNVSLSVVTLSHEHSDYKWVNKEQLNTLSLSADVYIDPDFVTVLHMALDNTDISENNYLYQAPFNASSILKND